MSTLLLNDRFELKKLIGQGSFGKVYLGVDNQTGKEIAVKTERSNCKYPQTSYEA